MRVAIAIFSDRIQPSYCYHTIEICTSNRAVMLPARDPGRRELVRQLPTFLKKKPTCQEVCDVCDRSPSVPSTHQAKGVMLQSRDLPAAQEETQQAISEVDTMANLHMVVRRAVRTATELVGPETAKELRAARRKLGLHSLTISERKAKVDVSSFDDAPRSKRCSAGCLCGDVD